MKSLLALSGLIDRVSERIGHTIYWLVLVAVLISAANAVVRKAFNWSSNSLPRDPVVPVLGDLPVLRRLHADAQRARAHRRHHRPPFDARAGLDRHLRHAVLPAADGDPHHVAVVAGVRRAYERHEVSTNAGGLIIWPARLMVPVGFLLLSLQGFSELIKRIAFLQGLIPDPSEKHAREDRRGSAGGGNPEARGRAGMRTRGQPEREGGMTAFLIDNMAPLMFAALVVVLLLGYPVAFALAAIGIVLRPPRHRARPAAALAVPGAAGAASGASCRTTRCSRSRSSPSWG